MRLLELKKLEINDDIPLYVTLYCKEPWKVDESGDIKLYKPVTRDSNCCSETPIYSLGLNPSSSKEKIDTLLQYFFQVCDVSVSPQSVWKTKDCDYISLLLEYTKHDQVKFDLVRDKVLGQFPELIMSENCYEKIPDNANLEDYIASIEVAYPETWTVEYEKIDS